MITDAFDNKSKPIFEPKDFYGNKENICDVAIATFSQEMYSYVLENFPSEQVAQINITNFRRNINIINVNGRKIVFYLSKVGSTLSTINIIEVNHFTGATKFIMFGACGTLNVEKTKNKFIIPTYAYRDEGASYHYKKASDYIKIKNSSFMQKFF